jgi:hypothetical protein
MRARIAPITTAMMPRVQMSGTLAIKPIMRRMTPRMITFAPLPEAPQADHPLA